MSPDVTPPMAAAGGGTDPGVLRKARSKARAIAAPKVPKGDFEALIESYEQSLRSLRETQESLLDTQRSLLETQEALAAACERLAELESWRPDASRRLDSLDDFVVPALSDGVRAALSRSAGLASAPVSVVITTCDRPQLLARALRSLAVQDRLPQQVVVVNDGTDPVDQVLEEFRTTFADIDLVHTDHARSGSASARNRGLEAATEPFITYLDDDNEMAPGWVSAVCAHFESTPDSHAVYGGQIRIGLAGEAGLLFQPVDDGRLAERNVIDTGMLAHRKGLDVAWNPDLRRLTDWDFALSVSETTALGPLGRLASLYDSSSDTSRISTEGSFRLYRDSVQHRHAAGPTGDQARCCLCDFVGTFGPGPSGQPRASCPNCLGLPRHRLLAVLLPALTPGLIAEGATTALEVAPFQSSRVLFEHNGMRLLCLDADPDADGREVDVVGDLEHLPVADDSLPMLVVSHVLEHVTDDRAAIAEMSRVLTPSGVAIVQVPLRGDGLPTEEDVHADEAERIARFGQRDHVRLYGEDIVDRFRATGLAVHRVAAADLVPEALIEVYRLARNEPYFLLHPVQDCGPDCWLAQALDRAHAAVQSLNAYLGDVSVR